MYSKGSFKKYVTGISPIFEPPILGRVKANLESGKIELGTPYSTCALQNFRLFLQLDPRYS